MEDEDESDEDESDEDEDEDEDMTKRASKIVFNNPSQLSAEAVEAAIAAGDTRFANTILAARHERRVRLATQIETNIKTAQNRYKILFGDTIGYEPESAIIEIIDEDEDR